MKIIFYLTVLVIGIFLISNVYGQIDESDLTLELEGIDNPMVKEFKINNDEVFNEICPSNQCTIEYTHTFLDPPSPEINKYDIGYSIDFNLLDPITNKDLTPIQKKFVERFDVGITCFVKNVEDIIESNDTQNVKYNCSDDRAYLTRIHDSTSWYFDSKGVYDSALNNFKLVGNYK